MMLSKEDDVIEAREEDGRKARGNGIGKGKSDDDTRARG